MTGFRRRHALRKRYGTTRQLWVVFGIRDDGVKEYVAHRQGVTTEARYAWKTSDRAMAEAVAEQWGGQVEGYRGAR